MPLAAGREKRTTEIKKGETWETFTYFPEPVTHQKPLIVPTVHQTQEEMEEEEER